MDDRVDPEQLGSALDQSAVDVILARELVASLGGDPLKLVSDRVLLITPKNVGLMPLLSEKRIVPHINRIFERPAATTDRSLSRSRCRLDSRGMGSLYDMREDREHKSSFSIETEKIRRHLSTIQPTYIPQLHAARYLVVVTAPESPTESDYARQVVATASEYGKNAIVAVLCPKMTGQVRTEVRRQLHTSSLFAGTIDDLDLCRLLNPGGIQPNLVIGLLEILLEQQPWKARNPFSVPEGSEMRLEMYVGRQEEARQLATTADKTRLFSGRKLGKTALLQFIRQTEDGRELPNGQSLRVVYVSIVGVDREDLFAKKVLEQLRQDFPDVSLPSSLKDPEDILEALKQLLSQRLYVDLLIVLDEADEFVSAQVREDKRSMGKGLSWKLRGNPRVRYVFTGYWATATRDGVWYNWGDVLELSQLSPEEAAGLIARPSARLGINAGAQAAEIAFRCGYQPAFLLRYGERLVEEPGGGRRSLRPTSNVRWPGPLVVPTHPRSRFCT